MAAKLVYDLPTRLFHWIFAGLFLTSFVIAKTVDDESIVFSYHMISGLLMAVLILWRLVWGVMGSQHARFSGFALHPKDLIRYLQGIFTGSKERWSGHNPASSWAAMIMLALGIGLAITGFLMARGNEETFEEIHELLANGFILVVILHVSGVILHSLRHKEILALTMLHGKKAGVETSDEISSSRFGSALVLVLLMVGWGFVLFSNFDSNSRTLGVLGQTLKLGEGGEGNEHQGLDPKGYPSGKSGYEDHDENDDD